MSGPWSLVGLIAVVFTVLGLTVGPREVVSTRARQPLPASADRGQAPDVDGEARTMHAVSAKLARDVTRAARCDPRRARFDACVLPALRSGGIGGREAGRMLTTVVASAPAGSCRGYLLELQAADQALGEQVQWLLARLYDTPRGGARREVADGLRHAAPMMARATRAGPPRACAPAGAGLAI
ncbi:MAG: hypothetical protein QOG35_754 [Solirubrobacteraceae bacterium]|jgi:hypothetical protein|nr:hypothetical protein [Solirubrobacteraceae bacterium]